MGINDTRGDLVKIYANLRRHVNLALVQILRQTSITTEQLQRGNQSIKAELDLVEADHRRSTPRLCHLYSHQLLALDLSNRRSLQTLQSLSPIHRCPDISGGCSDGEQPAEAGDVPVGINHHHVESSDTPPVQVSANTAAAKQERLLKKQGGGPVKRPGKQSRQGRNKGAGNASLENSNLHVQKQKGTGKRPNNEASSKPTPSKKPKTGNLPDQQYPPTADPKEDDSAIPPWEEWDNKREADYSSAASTRLIKATEVYERVSSATTPCRTTGNGRKTISPSHYHQIVTMVLAPGNSHAFRVLKEVINYLQQYRTETILHVSSADPKVLFHAVDAIETSGNLDCFLRRFALSRLAKMYRDTCSNRGELLGETDSASSSKVTVTKKHKSKAYVSMIRHTFDVPFPVLSNNVKMTRKELIDSVSPEAVRWNKCKVKLTTRIEPGQRWLGLTDRFGQLSIGLITKNWLIDHKTIAASDTFFEDTLTIVEYEALLNEIECTKGSFLRSLNEGIGPIFEFIRDFSRARTIPLLQIDDQNLSMIPECATEWVETLKYQENSENV